MLITTRNSKTAKRIKIPKYTSTELDILNIISKKNQFFSLDIYSHNLTVKFSQYPVSLIKKSNNHIWIKLTLNGNNFVWISLPVKTNFIFTGNENLRPLIRSKSKTIRILTYEVILSPIIQKLEKVTQNDLNIQNISYIPPLIDKAVFITFLAFDSNKISSKIKILFDHSSFKYISDTLNKLPDKPLRKVNNLSIHTNFEFGYTNLPSSEYKEIEIGDVILVEHLYSPDISTFKIVIKPNLIITIEQQGSDLIVNNITSTQSNNNDHDTYNSNIMDPSLMNENGKIRISELQINISFSLGGTQLTLDDVQNLQVGSILSLKKPSTRAVQIYNNSQILGEGELVRVEDQVGVRIVELFSEPQHG